VSPTAKRLEPRLIRSGSAAAHAVVQLADILRGS
jgi:hypothetical protein